MTLMTLLIAPVAGRRMHRIGARRLATVGLALTAGALFALTWLTPHTNYVELAAMLAALGAGLALALPVAAAVAMSSIDAERVGIGAGIATMARQLGGAIGLAVLVPLGARIAAGDYPRPASAAVIALVKGGQARVVGRLLGPRAQADAAAAFVNGITDSLWLAVAVVAVALLAALLLPDATERKQRHAEVHLNHRTEVERGC